MSKTADPFLNMLTPTAHMEQQRNAARSIHKQATELAKARHEPPRAPFQPDYSAELDDMELPKPHPRPSYADDIDRIVAQLIADGLVVFDQATDSYRRPNVRRWRFA